MGKGEPRWESRFGLQRAEEENAGAATCKERGGGPTAQPEVYAGCVGEMLCGAGLTTDGSECKRGHLL